MQFRTIGILGGGQLGRMLTFAAAHGDAVVILDPDPMPPAAQVADRHVVGKFPRRAENPRMARSATS